MKTIYIALGFVCFGLGAIGVVLPMLPTTPFLLLASFFFAKGSKRFEDWFLSTKLYKNHLDSFAKERAMTLKTKAMILGFASTMLIICFIVMNNIIGRVVIILLIIIKYYYFTFHIKTIKEEKKEKVD